MNFNKWMIELNETLIRNVGIDTNGLPDQPYRRWFEEGMSAGRAAYKALKQSGWDAV